MVGASLIASVTSPKPNIWHVVLKPNRPPDVRTNTNLEKSLTGCDVDGYTWADNATKPPTSVTLSLSKTAAITEIIYG